MLRRQKGPSVCDCAENRAESFAEATYPSARARFQVGMATAKKSGGKTAGKKSAAKKTAGRAAAKTTAARKTPEKTTVKKAAAEKKESLVRAKRSTGDGPACWPGFQRVPGKEAGTKGSCKPKPNATKDEKKEDAREAAGAKLRKAGGKEV